MRKGEGGAPRSKGFAGTGTTLKCAKDLNRRVVGIEINEQYCEIAATRLSQQVLALFSQSSAQML
ncbi:DNA methyltransferase [Nostoc favosum]|uniref:Site-specific DNA-methyltransferase n=1 Tax=Nostoc favosum CHAB5714 TaxID=2780399 RepID=A0ABS8ILG5_9NOSO|nr:DNA methyltransferase [Nostoc favosum]MCC5604312.1 site-specific DNA-methyltransferase [Nostoc favosum CHAB5714]